MARGLAVLTPDREVRHWVGQAGRLRGVGVGGGGWGGGQAGKGVSMCPAAGHSRRRHAGCRGKCMRGTWYMCASSNSVMVLRAA